MDKIGILPRYFVTLNYREKTNTNGEDTACLGMYLCQEIYPITSENSFRHNHDVKYVMQKKEKQEFGTFLVGEMNT